LMTTYGKDQVIQATRQLMDYTERMLRREIAKIPDGDYVAKGFLTMTAATVASRCRSR
jgi:N-methylhydantoinase B